MPDMFKTFEETLNFATNSKCACLACQTLRKYDKLCLVAEVETLKKALLKKSGENDTAKLQDVI